MKFFGWLLLVILCVAVCSFAAFKYGVTSSGPASENSPDVRPPSLESIVGQGKLQPADGIIEIYAPPGQQVESLAVKLDDLVERDQPLAVLAIRKVRELELEIAKSQKADAERQANLKQQGDQMQVEVANIAGTELDEAKTKIQSREASIEAIEKGLAAARDMLAKLERLKSNVSTSDLIGQLDIDKQSGLVLELEAKLATAQGEMDSARQALARSGKQAEQQLKMVEFQAQATAKAVPTATLELAVDAAELALDATTLKSPVKGRVLDLAIHDGGTATTTPIMSIGNTDRMVCIAEIADTQLKRVRRNASVEIHTSAVDSVLKGTVIEVGKMIAPPSLKDPNPFVAVDRKTGKVKIALDAASSAKASNFVNLQVEVRIAIGDDTQNASDLNATDDTMNDVSSENVEVEPLKEIKNDGELSYGLLIIEEVNTP